MKHKVKVTVIDKKLFPELQSQYCADPRSGPCPCYNVGDEFVFERDEDSDHFWHGGLNTLVKTYGDPDKVAGGPRIPHCSEAWDAISRYIYAGLQGGSIMKGWMRDERVMIACCSDGTRPVIFKIERIDEEEPQKAPETASRASEVPPAAVPAPDTERQKSIAERLFSSKGKASAPQQKSRPDTVPAPEQKAPFEAASPDRASPGLPDLFESPRPWDPRTDGDFEPTLDFGRYWRLNYSYLSAEEKKAYEDMEAAILRGFSSVKVDLPPDETLLTRILKALIMDNWSLFYIDTSATIVREPGRTDVCFAYNRFKEDRGSWMRAMKEAARNIFEAKVKGCRTRYEAELAIHDFLTGSVTYDKSDHDAAYSPLGPLLWNKGVCEGISEAFAFLACSCGLKAAMTYGKLKNGAHRWNVVEIDNERYNVDVTSDLSGLHAYLNCSDDTIGRSHTLSRRMGCDTDRLNFYSLNGCRFKTAYDAKGYIEERSRGGKGAEFELMLENGVMPQEITRMARNGAGGSAGITVTNLDYRFYRVVIRRSLRAGSREEPIERRLGVLAAFLGRFPVELDGLLLRLLHAEASLVHVPEAVHREPVALARGLLEEPGGLLQGLRHPSAPIVQLGQAHLGPLVPLLCGLGVPFSGRLVGLVDARAFLVHLAQGPLPRRVPLPSGKPIPFDGFQRDPRNPEPPLVAAAYPVLRDDVPLGRSHVVPFGGGLRYDRDPDAQLVSEAELGLRPHMPQL